MHKKKSRSSAPELIPLTARDEEEVPLGERPAADSSSWSNLVVEEGPSTTEVNEGERQGELRELNTKKHEERRGQLLRSFSSTTLSPDDCTHSFSLSTRSLSSRPKRPLWYPMRLVQLSVLVAALTVVAVLALVFTLHYGETGRQGADGALHHSGIGADSGASDNNATIRGRRTTVPSGDRHDQSAPSTAPSSEQVHAASVSTPVRGGENAPSAIGSAASRASSLKRVVWWNNEGFGLERPGPFPLSALDLASERSERQQRDSAAHLDKRTYGAKTLPTGSLFSG